MSDTTGIYAMMISGSTVVQNVTRAAAGTTIPGFTLVAIGDGICCNPGSFYNEADGKFYQDSAFATLTGLGSDSVDSSDDTTKTTYSGVSDLAATMQDDSTTTATDESTTSS